MNQANRKPRDQEWAVNSRCSRKYLPRTYWFIRLKQAFQTDAIWNFPNLLLGKKEHFLLCTWSPVKLPLRERLKRWTSPAEGMDKPVICCFLCPNITSLATLWPLWALVFNTTNNICTSLLILYSIIPSLFTLPCTVCIDQRSLWDDSA